MIEIGEIALIVTDRCQMIVEGTETIFPDDVVDMIDDPFFIGNSL